jgi:anti-sigma regulatory factor (Ser/Thr protein kinase)
MAPFIVDGLEQGDRIFAATKRSNIDALRDALGKDAALVDFHDTTVWQTRPYARLQAFKLLVNELPGGGTLRAMGEPVWSGSDAVLRQWARYESIINLALARAPMRFICLYDSTDLPDQVLDYAVHTHPERLEAGSTIPCPAFVPPEDFIPGAPSTPPRTSRGLPLQGHAFRRRVAEQALDAGLPRESVEDFVLAANEVATNALLHGRPPIRANMWLEDTELVCQVADAGPGIADPLAGWMPPAAPANGGWGLAIARQLCDAVEITRNQPGTTVSLHLSLPAHRPAG